MTFSLSVAKLLSGICCLAILLTVTQSTDVPREGSHTAPRKELSKESCYSQCDSRYSSSKTEPWLACHHGCRLLTLLGQMASGKSHKEVKHSCLSACTEAYNVTAQEKACHAGCGDQVGEKKKSGSERHVSAESRAAAPTPTAPSKTPSPSGIRYFWSKSIVDEQDVDSSSEERMRPPHSASQSSFPPGNDPFREVFNGIWPLRLLPPSFRITKSSVTYIGSESLNSQSATNRQAVAKQTAVPFLTSLMKGLTRKTSPQTQESGDTPGHGSEARPPKPEKGANYTVLSWKPGGTVGRPDIMLFFIGLSFFSAFFLLFRAIIATKNYLPISTLDIKKDDAAGEHDTGEDDLDSDDESLFGMGSRLVLMSRRPPTYEQAQQDLNAKLNRPLLVSLDLPASNNTTC